MAAKSEKNPGKNKGKKFREDAGMMKNGRI